MSAQPLQSMSGTRDAWVKERKQWPLQRIVLMNVVVLVLLVVVGSGFILRNVHSSQQRNHENLLHAQGAGERLQDLVHQVGSLLQQQLPLRHLVAEQQSTSQQVRENILLYILEDEEGSAASLQQGMDKLIAQQQTLVNLWPADLPNKPLESVQSNVDILTDIVGEILETASRAQLEELAHDSRTVAANLVQAMAELNLAVTAAAARSNESILQSSDIAIEANRVTLENADVLNTLMSLLTRQTLLVMGAVILVLIGFQVIVFSVLRRRLMVAVETIDRFATGDLDVDCNVSTKDEIGRLMTALKSMQERLTSVIMSIKSGADAVNTAAVQITQGGINLSQRTEEQAASLQETAASMEEMFSTVKQTAENARQANEMTTGARTQAQKGGEVVSKMVAAMSEINTASEHITDIIGVIDEIAFQTNLLALNAAVEAARAGEHGHGFAVVAAEVRNLAQRSATAAKEIKQLINDSVDRVKAGSELADESGKTLEEIVKAVKKVSDIVAEITAASQEQSAGIDQVNKSVLQLDELTQQNAAMAEESSSSSIAMSEQAQLLNDQVSFFRVRGELGVASAESARHPDDAEEHMQHVETAKLAQAHSIRQAANRPHDMTRTGTEDSKWEEF
jgi:methyl-accepting chemotaxis protein